MAALTVRQQQFVREYLIDGNATRAATAAGYSPNSASGMGSQLLKLPHVRTALDLHRARLLRERDITADRVLEEYRRIAFADARDLHRPDGSMRAPHEWSDEVASQLAGIEVSQVRTVIDGAAVTEERTLKVKRWDKMKALDVLAKHTGVVADGSTAPGARTDTPSLDPARIARMDDADLEQALALVRRMDTPNE
jgi:phage terminase small subunit